MALRDWPPTPRGGHRPSLAPASASGSRGRERPPPDARGFLRRRRPRSRRPAPGSGASSRLGFFRPGLQRRSLAAMSPEPVPPPPPPPQCPGCDCGEPFAKRLEKGDEAFRAGEYEMAAELFRSMLAGLAQPDRGLCLRLGDALARARRLPEALGAFRGAARLGALRPEELGELVGSLACALGRREWRLQDGRPGRAPEEPREEQPASAPVAPRDLLGCPRCQRLLHKPVTLPCGLTVCKRCVESGAARPQARRVNVVLNGLLEKCFPAECRVRRLAGQARTLQRQQQPEAALLRSDQALDLGKSALGAGPPALPTCRVAEVDMERFV